MTRARRGVMDTGEVLDDSTLYVPTCDDIPGDEEVLRLFREEARRRVERQLAAGRPVYFSGIGPEAHKLYLHLPNGRCFQYRVAADGQREIVGEFTP